MTHFFIGYKSDSSCWNNSEEIWYEAFVKAANMFVPEKAREIQTDEIEFVVNFERPKKGK